MVVASNCSDPTHAGGDAAAHGPSALPRSLDLVAAAPLREMLRARLHAGAPLVLNAGDVERVSTACVQVLLAAAAAAGARNLPFTLRDASPALVMAAQDLGVAARLSL